jgi:hypothetical protein
MSEQAELLPCPFCGGKAQIAHSQDGDSARVICHFWPVCMGSGAWKHENDEAIANWNLRAPVAAPVPQWISVEDRLPENGQTVIAAWLPDYPNYSRAITYDPPTWRDGDGDQYNRPSHWMPLPAAPQPK